MPVELCTIDSGTYILGQQYISDFLNALYEFLIEAQHELETIFELPWEIRIPGSDASFVLLDEGGVPDFRIEPKKFWAISVDWKDYHIGNIPLPKGVFSSVHDLVYSSLDIGIPGSENWYYTGDDGVRRKGYEFDPVRKFHLLSDGGNVVGILSILIVLIFIFQKMGLFSLIKRLISKVMMWRRRRKLNSDLDEIMEAIETKVSKDDFQTNMGEINQSLDRLARKIGIRLAFL